MTSLMKLTACAAVLAALAGCGEERGADGLTQSERDRLNAAAAALDNSADVIDASPDSLVAADEANATETGGAANAQ
ncbi:MAG TPA: hypothetical protein VD887_04465 [Allosphingosinicella sp.]|nr:hypothetical protein [Allosphingosinicella sp.]